MIMAALHFTQGNREDVFDYRGALFRTRGNN
jgi:hypothetical protein